MTTEHQHRHGRHAHSSHGGHGHGPGAGGYDPANLRRADAFYGDTYQQVVDWLDIQPGTAALEAGSGAGGFTELLAGAVGPTGSVAALDAAPHLLQAVRDRLEGGPFQDRVSYHEGDIQGLPFDSGRFDLVWSSRTIHHLPDQLAGIRELRRVLKPGGRLALREGGLGQRLLPVDLGLGAPGLEARLEQAFNGWFYSRVRGGAEVVPYHHGWTQLLRDAGLTKVTARTFLLELLPPFTEVQKEFMVRQLDRWVSNEERRAFISDEDAAALQQIMDPASPHYLFHRPDLHYLDGVTVYLGEAWPLN